MNKEIIEQIEKIKGVKTVEPCDDKVVVTFEPEHVSITVTSLEQFNFVRKQKGHSLMDNLIYPETSITTNPRDSFDAKGWYNKFRGMKEINFTQYLTDYDLTEEWEKYLIGEAEKRYPKGTRLKSLVTGSECVCIGVFKYSGGDIYTPESGDTNVYDGKWAEIIEEVELVEGCIYFDKDNGSENIFRFRKKSGSHLVYYSLKWEDDDEFKKGDKHSYDISEIRLATKKQKKKLIRAEVKNGYFHELN